VIGNCFNGTPLATVRCVPPGTVKEPRRPTPTYSEVIYETQPTFIVHECPGPRGLLEAAVDFTRPGRFNNNRPGRAVGLFELDLEHAARGSVQPVHDTTARQQR
jgi:hypothetical protein